MIDSADDDGATACPTTGIAMAAGILGKGINTVANLEETRETEVCKQHKIYIAYTKNTAEGRFCVKRPSAHFISSRIFHAGSGGLRDLGAEDLLLMKCFTI